MRSLQRYGVLFLFLPSLVLAKAIRSPASAGILERQIQQEYNLEDLSPQKEVPILEIDIPPETLSIPEGASAYIQTIQLQGNTLLSSTEIQTLLSPYEGKTLHGKELIALCTKIDEAYARKGYIFSWTYPPVQKITEHTLVLQVLEGTLEQIHITGNRFYKSSYIENYLSDLQGKPLNYNDLIEVMLLLQENFHLAAKGILKKGSQIGGIDLHILIEDSLPLSLSGGYNNWGSNLTAYNRIFTEIDGGNLLMTGDKVVVMTAFGVPPAFYYVNPVYSLPLGKPGSRLQLGYLYSHSNTQAYPDLQFSGYSEIGTFSWKMPLKRSRQFSSDLFTSFDVKQVKNLTGTTTVSYDRLRVLTAGALLDYIDSVQGRTFFSAYLHAGIPDFLGGSPAVNPQSSRIGSGARYYILNANFQRLQTLPRDCRLLLSTSAQGTWNTLPVPEQIFIGGVGTVRGYPAAVFLGDVGYYGSCELYLPPPFIKEIRCRICQKPWKEVLQFLAFVDHGGVYTIQKENLTGGPPYTPPGLSPSYLTSTGVGMRIYGPHQLQVSLDWAFPLTNQGKLFSNFLYFRISMSGP